MKHKATIDVIAGNKILNDIMKAANLRDSSKCYADYTEHAIEFTGDASKLADVFYKSYENCDRMVVFVGVRSIDGVKPATPIYALHSGAKISQISDGKIVALFKDVLTALDYTVEVDERNRVVSIL